MTQTYYTRNGLKYRDLVKLGITARASVKRYTLGIYIMSITFTYDDTQMGGIQAMDTVERYLAECWPVEYTRARYSIDSPRWHVRPRWIGNTRFAFDMRIHYDRY